MTDVLIKLLEKLIELTKHRKEVEEKPFDLLISPLYSKLETIHRDYLRMFESCRSDLKSGVQLEVVAKHFMADRLELEALRRSVVAFAESYGFNPRLKPYEDFFKGVVEYFYGTDIGRERSHSAHLLQAMEHLLSEEVEFEESEFLTEEKLRTGVTLLIQRRLLSIRESWKKISQEFARLGAKRATG